MGVCIHLHMELVDGDGEAVEGHRARGRLVARQPRDILVREHVVAWARQRQHVDVDLARA